MEKAFINNVNIVSGPVSVPGHRIGTAFMTYDKAIELFGPPNQEDLSNDGLDGCGKVHFSWAIKTPRGMAEIRDYWWNPNDQQSIAASNANAYWWIRGWLKLKGIKAECGCGK